MKVMLWKVTQKGIDETTQCCSVENAGGGKKR